MVLLIDNYDSFTYNLRDYILQCGKDCMVVRNDEMRLSEIAALKFDSIVISPGPKTPAEAGITNEVIQQYYSSKPILGICLGHQAIGVFFGAKLNRAPSPMHGKTSAIQPSEHFLFSGLPGSFEVMRYHSLILTDVENTPLRILAKTNQGEVMAIGHPTLPVAGLQFHPESILTPHGLKMMKNWFLSIG